MYESNPYSISVVIPAYNEEAYIEKSVTAIEEILMRLTKDCEIIVVNDASTDRTAQILHRLKESKKYLRVVSHSFNQGLGQSLISGFNLCRKDVVFYTDADLPFDFEELSRALRIMRLKDAEIVAGFRHDRTSEGLLRIIYSLGYNLLIRFLFGIAIRDINFSFKLIQSKALQKMRLQSQGSFIDAEMMIKADKMNLFICQIGIDYFKRKHGESHLSSPKVILKIIKEMILQYPSLIKFKPAS